MTDAEPTVNLSSTDPVLAFMFVVLMTTIVLLLALIASRLKNRSASIEAKYAASEALRDATEQLRTGVRDRVTTETVNGILQQLDDRPDALNNLKPYANNIVAAVLMTRLASLENQHRDTISKLESLRSSANENWPSAIDNVLRLEGIEQHLRTQVEEAQQACLALLAAEAVQDRSV